MREASGAAAGLASLPSGGGGISPLGERFQPDLVRGTGSYGVPLNFPRGPNEQRPSMALTYSTGSGNGPFGVGWRLDVMRIERRTDRGIPAYTDDDTFVIGDAEILVPVGGNRFRPRTDNKFWMIERFGDGWRIRTGEGRTLFFGQAGSSREFAGARVFAWYLNEELDAAGNSIRYTYRRDGNRLYLDEVQYSIFSFRLIYEVRPDVVHNARSGFERTMALRVKEMEMHCTRLVPTLMRTYKFTYQSALNGTSQLTRLELSATEDGETAAFPELRFDYSSIDFNTWKVHEPRAPIAPPSLDDNDASFVDLTGDGLPDILQTTGSRMLLWRNLGEGELDGPLVLGEVPSTVSLSRDNVAFADLNGNGRVDLFAVDQPLQVAFESNGKGGFAPNPIVFRDHPNLRLSASDTRLMDVDGDGIIDLINTGRTNFLLYRHQPGIGWQEPQPVNRVADLEQFPDVSFADRGVRLADMTGDGLQDFLTVQSGNVCYWPYFGNGVWGHRVEMRNSPLFPSGYREERVHVVDIDGDGCSDIIYFDYDRTLIWINQSGAGFSAPIEIPVTPIGSGRIVALDFFADGRPAFVWSAGGTREDSAGCRVLRFDEGHQPYLMKVINNGMGGSFEMEYSSSTQMRLADRSAGRAWTGELPFAVQVVSTIRERDLVTSRATEIKLSYHDGTYDGPEREFRGFKNVTVSLTGDESVPTTRQEFEFFQGAPELVDLSERRRQRALSGAMVSTKTFEQVGADFQLRQQSTQVWDTRLEHDGVAGQTYFPFVTSIETQEISSGGTPPRIEVTRLSNYDIHGNAGKRTRESFVAGMPPAERIRTEEIYSYTSNEVAWLIKLPVRLELRDGTGVLFATRINYYDGAAFTGLPEGQVDKGLGSRVQELKLLESRLPADYIGGRDFAALGFEVKGAGNERGFYATTNAVRRDLKGNVIEQRDPLGRPMSILIDGDGVYPVETLDANGRKTSLIFNPKAGEPSQISFPDGRIVRYEYDAIGRLAATFETDDGGNEQLVKCWIADTDSLPTSLTSIAPKTTGRMRADFTPATNFETLTGVSVSRVYYDGFGKELMQVSTAPDGPGGARRFVTSGQMRLNAKALTSVQYPPSFVPTLAFLPAPAGATPDSTRQRYDALGNATETAGPGPLHFRVVRDTLTINHFEGAGAGAFGMALPPGPPVRIEHFDARNRLVRVEEAKGDGTFISTGYDLAVDGRIEVVRDSTGNEGARYVFAGPAESVRITHPDAGTRTYYRNAAGQLVERIDADGSKLLHSYDSLSRLIRIEHVPAANAPLQLLREIIYDTDPAQPSAGRFLDGRIAVTREMGNEFRYSYNRAGKCVREDVTAQGVTLSTRRVYDLQGRPSAIIYHDGRTVEYVLDDSGVVKEIFGVLSNIDYTANGIIQGYRLANGVDVAMPRDAVSRRLNEISARSGAGTIRSVAYTYDTVGNIVGFRDEQPGTIEQHTFTYDGLARLTGFSVRAGSLADPIVRAGVYTYDATGNLRQFEDGKPLALNYTDLGHPGRVTSITQEAATRAISYNSRGHIEAMGDLTQIDFDPFDRVTRVTKADGTVVRLAYDPQSRRILKDVTNGGTTRRVRYATGLYELHETHALRHIYLGVLMVATERITTVGPPAATKVFYLSDHHGTILTSMDSAGQVINNQRYSPFGAALNNSAQLDRYLGRERDVETGLLHLGARYYAPAIGRFISPDWYVLENPQKPMRLPQGYNLYSYALNNPLIFKDPSGMWFGIDDLIVLAVGFAVGFVSGLVYGLANGQGWGSFLTALETGLTTAAGAWLGWTVAGPFGAVMGGMNGLVGGIHGIYDWGSVDGWFAFISDSTWGLLGTSLGNVVHILNLFGNSNYRDDLSRRQNRHVYEGGVYVKEGFAFTMGNVISNAGQNGQGINADFIANHEELHVWQSRFFGPIFQATYVVWAVGGFIVGSVVWLFNTDESYGSIIETAAYYDNPFEYWAYKNDNNWPPSGANPVITWG